MHKSSPGGSSSLPIITEEWSAPGFCGSDGTVQVKCTKITGTPFERMIIPHHIIGQSSEIKDIGLLNKQISIKKKISN